MEESNGNVVVMVKENNRNVVVVVEESNTNVVVVEEQESYRILWPSNLYICATSYLFLRLHSAPEELA